MAFLANEGGATPAGPKFEPAVKVTPPLGYGFEPGIVVDRFDNIFVTAHKENIIQMFASPDLRSSTLSRTQSWTWGSYDGGRTWNDLPVGPDGLGVDEKNYGDEGDYAVDDDGTLYFVDQDIVDATLTSWSIKGRGKIAFRSHLPLMLTQDYQDDRPWITAHNNGHVFVFTNNGGKGAYTGNTGAGYGTGTGAGRYTVYSSYDGGASFDRVGITLADSGWCRPASQPESPYVYALCGNDQGTMYAYASTDDGHKWSRYFVGKYTPGMQGTGWWTYPSLQVARDGSLWGFFLDPRHFDGDVPLHARMLAYHSTDHGRHWTTYDVTPNLSSYQYVFGWMSVSDDGKRLGYAVYGRPNVQAPWKIYATTFRLGEQPILTSVDDANPVTVAGYWEAPADFLMCAFDRDDRLNVVWTRAVIQHGQFVAQSTFAPTVADDVYFARSATPS